MTIKLSKDKFSVNSGPNSVEIVQLTVDEGLALRVEVVESRGSTIRVNPVEATEC